MKLFEEQQKRLFTSYSSCTGYHAMIIRFCLSAAANFAFRLPGAT